MRLSLKERQIYRKKKEFRKALESYTRISDDYSCGTQLLLHMSSSAYAALKDMIDCAEWLIANDPDCPNIDALPKWKKLINPPEKEDENHCVH